MSMSMFGSNSKPDLFKQRSIQIKDSNANEIIKEMQDEGFLEVVRDYQTNEILFLCNYGTWHKIMIGDIHIEIERPEPLSLDRTQLLTAVRIDKNDTGCCASDCGYLNVGNDPFKTDGEISFCSLYNKELHGLCSKTRCGECHLENK